MRIIFIQYANTELFFILIYSILFLFEVLVSNYLLSYGIICLLPILSNTNSVSSTASSWEGFRTLPDRALGNLMLSRDEFIEFIILGFITMVVQGLLSFHHLEMFGNLLLQHLQQQQ